MALEDTSDILLLIFVTVSIPFYILFLISILINRRKEPFNSSFFILCTSLGVADIATLVHSYIFVKAPGWSWGNEFWVEYGFQGSFLAFYGNAMLWGLTLAQHIGVLLIGINRCTAVAFTFRQENIWSKRNLAIAIAVQWTVPIIFVLPMTTTTFMYDYWRGPTGIRYSDNVNILFCNNDYEDAYYIAAIFINLIVNVTTCSMYIMVLVIAMKNAKKMKNRRISPMEGPTKTSESLKSNSYENEPRPGGNSSFRNSNPAIHLPIPVESQNVKVSGGGSIHEERAQKEGMKRRDTKIQQKKTAAAAVASWKHAHDRELRLAVCGFLMFLAMLVYFIFLLGVVIDGNYSFGYLWNIASDIVSYTSPYTLIIMSKQTRVAIGKLLKCKKC